MAESFDLVQEKNITLVLGELGQSALQRHAERGMRSRCPGLRPRGLLGIVVGDFLFAQPAAPRVVTGVDQDAVGPSDETGLAAKAGDAALHFQEGLLHGVFGVAGVAEDIARQVLHARAMQGVETVVGAQIAGSARRGQSGILASGIPDGRTGAASKVLGRFHSRPPFARHGRDSSLPRQRQSHSSHSWLLRYRRQGMVKCQACPAKGRLYRQTLSFRLPSIISLTSFAVLISYFIGEPVLFPPCPPAPVSVPNVLAP